MAGGNRLSARFGADTSDFKDGITAINREMKLVESEFRATASTMEDWSNNATGLETRMNTLNKTIDLQREKTEALKVRYEQLAKEHGENSIQAQNAQIEFNKEAEKLGKLQTELRKTETGLKSLKGETGKVKGAVHDMGTQFDKLRQQVPALGTAMSLLTNPLSLAIGLLGAFATAAKKSIKETVEYNKEVREMMQITGLSAEETSRIIQVSDDWGISIGEARSALEMMNKKGISPTIENLAKIADEYINTEDKSKFAEEANQKYGKSFSTLIPILAKGGDALREQAEAVNDNLIATDESIKASRDYEIAMDNLGDAVSGLSHTFGNDLLPKFTDLINVVNGNIAKYQSLKIIWEKLVQAEKLGLITTEDLIKVRLGLTIHTEDLDSITTEYTDELDKLNDITAYNTQITREEEIRRGKLTTATDGLTAAEKELADKTWDTNMAQAEAIRMAENEKQALSDMEWIISQPLTKSIEDFNETQGDLMDEMGEVQDRVAELNVMKYLTPEQQTELEGLITKQGELQTEYDNNATAHEEATKRILFDLAVEKLGVEGLLTSGIFEAMAEAWGLTEDAEIQAMIAADEAVNWLRDHPGDVEGMKMIIEGQATSWGLTRQETIKAHEAVSAYRDVLNSLEDKVIHITTYHEDMFYNKNYGEGPGGQHGLNMIVPTGFDNDTFPFWASSGERVVIIPPGERFGGALAAMQQMMAGMNFGMGGMGGGGGGYGRQMQSAGASIQIILQAVPEDEIEKRRQARYIVEEIQRRNL